MTIRDIPLNKLILSPRNMRQGEVFIDDLVANIGATGKVLQNLRVTAEHSEAGKATGRFEVHVGGRRWRALNVLVQRKAIKQTFPVPCAVCENEAEALEESIAENNLRLPPHPADQFAAFHALAQTEMTVTEIAERFSISPRIVERRLKLATVSPPLMDLFRKDELTLEHMAAFTLTDDHAAQEAAYFDVPMHSRAAWEVKRRIVGGAINTETNPLAQFVGLEAYRAAGGVVSQDLFDQADDAGFITDLALLERLATDKLEAEAVAVRAEGWAWVEVALSFDYSTAQQYGRAYPSPPLLTDEAKAEIERLTSEYQTLEIEAEDSAEAAERMEAIEAELSEIEGSGSRYPEPVMAITGAFVTVGHGGVLRIERGCAKPGADTKALRALDGVESGTGGSPYPTQERPKKEAGAISDKLALDLTAHRTGAIRAALLERPDVALATVVHSLLLLSHYGASCRSDRTTTLELQVDLLTNHPRRHAEGFEQSKAGQTLKAAQGRMSMLLPSASCELWSFLATQSQEQLLDLLAYATSGMVNAVKQPFDRPHAQRLVAADELAQALNLNMAHWWTATAQSYFGRVSKPAILAAVAETSTAQAAENIAGLKKAELAAEAERRVADKDWLPSILRPASQTVPSGEQEVEGHDAAVAAEGSDHAIAAE